jgi:hypothetical protein
MAPLLRIVDNPLIVSEYKGNMKSSRAYTLAMWASALAQVVLLIMAARANRHLLNQDATFLIRFASYYLDGRFDLAVSGWWGPMFSWVIAPLLRIAEEPLVAARIAMVLSALVFLFGTIRLLKSLELQPVWQVLGAWITSLATVYWSVMVIMPDLLYGGIVLLAISEMTSRRWLEGRRGPLLAGALAGMSYLAKPVGFPTSIVLVATAGVLSLVSRPGDWRAVARSVGWTVVVFLVVAAPWVAALSAKYGGLTVTTAAHANRALVSPPEVNRTYQPVLRKPAEGRFAWGEDPTEMFPDVPRWSPFAKWSYAKYQMHLSLWNGLKISEFLAGFDTLHFGLAALVWGLLVHAPWREQLRVERWRWSGAMVACISSIYVPLFAGEIRYYLAAFPLAFAAAAGMVTALTEKVPGRVSPPWLIGFVLVAFSFVEGQRGNLLNALHGLQDPVSICAGDLAVRLRAKGIAGPVAGAGDYDAPWSGEFVGVYLAFLLDQPFYGSDPHPTADHFKASGAEIIVIDRKAPAAAELSGDRGFVDLDAILFGSELEASQYPLKVFERPAVTR